MTASGRHVRGQAALRQVFLLPSLAAFIILSPSQAWMTSSSTTRVSNRCMRPHQGFVLRTTTDTCFATRATAAVARKTSTCMAAKGDNNKNDDEKSPSTSSTKQLNQENWWDFIVDPFESKIPEEYREEIYRAEANTKAAQERGPRIALYGVIAFVGIAAAFFNAFLTELRHPADPTLPSLESLSDLGFGWVESNFLWRFLFLNKIGGGLILLGGAAFGLLAETEFDSRRKTAESIWEEFQGRKQQKVKQQQKLQQREQKQQANKRKKREGSKEAKRMAALSEVIDAADVEKESVVNVAAVDTLTSKSKEEEKKLSQEEPAAKTTTTAATTEDGKDKNIFQSLQGFYEKADAMAASQALLLNKKLEEAGVLEKITDETGLKVIGKEAAAAAGAKSQQQVEKNETTTTPTTKTEPQLQDSSSSKKDSP